MAGSNIWHRGAMALILGLLLLLFVDNTVARTRDQTPLTMAQNTKKNVAIIGMLSITLFILLLAEETVFKIMLSFDLNIQNFYRLSFTSPSDLHLVDRLSLSFIWTFCRSSLFFQLKWDKYCCSKSELMA